MRKKINPLYFLIPMLHVALIVLLLFLQFKPNIDFSSNGEKPDIVRNEVVEPTEVKTEKSTQNSSKSKFKKEIGSILVYSKKKGKISQSKAKLSSAIVEAGNFAFLFEDKKELIFSDTTGKTKRLTLKEVTFDKKSVTMHLSDGLSITFTNDNKKSVLISGKSEIAGKISIAVSAGTKAKLSTDSNLSILTSTKKRDQFALLQSTSINAKTTTVTLFLSDSTSSIAKVVSIDKNKSLWTNLIAENNSQTSFSTDFKRYRNRAFLGWESGRYSPTTNLWKMGNNKEGLSAELISCFITEAYRRGKPLSAVQPVSQKNIFNYTLVDGMKYENLYINPDVASLANGIFYGNIKKNYDLATISANAIINKFRKAIKTKNYSIVTNQKLVEIITFWGTESDEKQLIQFLSNSANETVSTKLLPSLLLHTIDALALFPEDKELLTKSLITNSNKLISNITYSTKGFFIAENGEILTTETIKAAMALNKIEENNLAKETSITLMSNLINFIDKDGFMPEKINLSDFSSKGKKRVAPEEILLWNPNKEYAPHVERFKTFAGNIKLFHRAKAVKLTKTSDSITFNFKHWYGAGSDNKATAILNTFIIKSLPKYKKVSMWGAEAWPEDPGFEYWRVGFYYWDKIEMATVMLRHRSTDESISFYY